MAGSGGVLLVLGVAALLGEGDEVGEDHATEVDMVERLDGACLDVLLDVAINRLVRALLVVIPLQLGLQVRGKLPHLHPLDLVVERSQRHWSTAIAQIHNHIIEITQKRRTLRIHDPSFRSEFENSRI